MKKSATPDIHYTRRRHAGKHEVVCTGRPSSDLPRGQKTQTKNLVSCVSCRDWVAKHRPQPPATRFCDGPMVV